VTDDGRLEVTFRGVRGSVPTPVAENLGYGGNTSCIEVRSGGGQTLLIDGGTGVRTAGAALIREAGQPKTTVHLLFTHFHWDHIQGLPFFAPLYSAENEVLFYSGLRPGGLREALEVQMSSPYYPIPLERLAAKRTFAEVTREFQLGEVSIHPFPLNHPQGATGFRIECGGAVVVHASDNEHGDPRFDSLLIDHARNADVLIYDAQYTPEEYPSKRGWGHSTWKEGARVAREAAVKRLVLFHHDPLRSDADLSEIVTQARREFENTDAATEGVTVRV